MTEEKLYEYLQYFTCKHASLLEKLNIKWSTGVCAEAAHCQNIIIINLLEVLKRVTYDEATVDTVTFLSSEFPKCSPPLSVNYTFTINEDVYSFDFGCDDDAFTEIVNYINTEGKYTATYTEIENLWELTITAPFGVTITTVDSLINFYVKEEFIYPREVFGTATVTLPNCLTDEEICNVICKLEELLENCNCNG